ncbi:hypothetical protein K7X08_035168 [Anisodus acutangulus]|uniref:Low-temperature-induced 65 kDa protein n=1 Tax=Anisodus acutangulus TaxID=402998 RepID=A0A9Q1LGQ4_9SOLA|nr:hypothetical protein K7X08_035168 [Anisodus acutangulus]
MESQLHRPKDTGLHSGEVHDEGEHHHKKSVLKKVEAKAKKIKDHLKHGLGHEHDHEHEHNHHPLQGDDEEEETDDEDMEEGAEVHGGPYAVRSKDIRKEDVGPMGNLENPTSPKEDRYDSKMKNEEVHRPTLQRQDEFARPPSLEGTHFPEDRQRPPFAETHETKGFDHEHEHQGLQGHENIGASTGLEDHHAREAAHRPTTAAETHETKGFDHVTAPGKQGYENIGAPTGLANPHPSHFREEMHRPPPVAASETHETEGFDRVIAHGKLKEQGVQGRKIGVLRGVEEDSHAPKERPEMNPNPTNYQSKVTDPTGANNEEAGVGPLVQSFEKMGVNDAPKTTKKQGIEGIRPEPRAGDVKLDQGTEHRQYTGSHDQFAPQEEPIDFPSGREDTESIPKSMNPSKPEDLPQDKLTGKPGSYAENISSATSAIADKAVAAKNVVACKLGYSGTEEDSSNSQVTTGGDRDATKTTSATELAQKAASIVAEKLGTVYEKVAVAGSTVMAKVQGTESRGGDDSEHERKTKETDKGVSMKEYLAEKFKPGEEDKALSEVISGSLSRQKDKTEETGEAKPMGKVTESEEVERRLGPIEDTKKENDGETHVGEGFGQGVVDRVKGAFNTWLGKGGEAQANDSAAGVGGGAVVGVGVGD